ncbi:hypothetical protein [Stenotrophomonas rhizophila]|uniref:hypothetical protein n=1 Tax=Stenotrophomonas rhizophila TaxID=216778 RepID=UPI001E2C1774|nr:hypothetical protein [Stenotrophomonas rhizophila]
MNNAKKTRKNGRSPRRTRLAAFVMGAVMTVTATSANAGMPVIDYTAIIQAIRSNFQDIAEFAKDNTRWIKLLREYTNALVTVQGIVNNFGLSPAATLTLVPNDYMVTESCGPATDTSLSGMFAYFVFDAHGDVKAQQRQICVNIRMMQNRKYNDSVMFIKETVPLMDQSLKAIQALRQSSQLLGNMTAVNSDAVRTANDLAVQAQAWQGRMQSYDAYIEVMEANQKVVAQAALKGDPTKQLISDMVKTAALKTALSVD